jgi:hypothetical protein
MDNPSTKIAFLNLNWLNPPTGSVQHITLLMFIPVLLAYIGRILIHQSLEYARESAGLLWLMFCPAVILGGSFVAALIATLAVISVRRAHHLAPALVLLGGIALVPFLPLPPLPKPVLPEEEFFHTHRAEFEQVVNLARENKLKCLQDLGCDVSARDLPPDYAHLSTTGFAHVFYNSSDLIVKFWPIGSYYPVTYFEKPEDRNLFWNYACRDSRWSRKLDEHWYLCVEDWN